MTDSRWNEVLAGLKSKFEVIEEGQEQTGSNGICDFCIFESPLGRLKIERTVKPKLLEKNTRYSNRVGSDVVIDYVFSENETVSSVKVYKEVEGDWEEFNADALI